LVGKTESSDTGDARSYLKWDLTAPNVYGSKIVKAEIGLYQYEAGACAATAVTNVYPLK
jgi:hypothetical protein